MAQSTNPSRDLLFGLLALQNGLIDQSALVAAFASWSQDRSKPLADSLVARGALDAEQRGLLEALANQHLKRHGSVETSLAALASSTHVDLLGSAGSDIETTIARLASGSATTGLDADRTVTDAARLSAGVGGRFRVLRPHARGGLGAVHVALDSELNREVALKEILDGRADDLSSRQRFVLEAEITGGLEHPGIVPVYGLGTYPDGRPFYAMRFVRGDTLREAIRRFHADPSFASDPGAGSLKLRELLRRFVDVCNAVEYAHSRGVIHRDLKPGNVIVGQHGETLVVDWGLAKAVGRSDPELEERTLRPASATDAPQTLVGQALGTPGYLSPEQARGDLAAQGPRSDVYSLGATLYCILTGKPPFQGDLVDVLRDVAEGVFPHPRSVRPTVPRALEAICLKAMATRPVDRYPTCRALADEIDRWMADEPVAAYPEPWTDRARRWVQRHRLGAAAVASAVVAALPILAIGYRAQANLRGESDRRFDQALQAATTFSTGVSRDFLLGQDAFKELRGRLLEEPERFYKALSADLAASGRADARSRLLLAQAQREHGRVLAAVNRRDDAERALGDALQSLEGLSHDDAVIARAEIHLALGEANATWDRAAEAATQNYRKAAALLEPLAVAPDARPEVVLGLASSLGGLGASLHHRGMYNDAREALQRAIALYDGLARQGDDPTFAIGAARCRSNLGMALRHSGQIMEAVDSMSQALRTHEELEGRPGIDPAEQLERVAAYRTNLSNFLSQLGPDRADAAVEMARQALADFKALATRNPNVPLFRFRVGLGQGNLAFSLARSGRIADSVNAYRDAIATYRAILDQDPSNYQTAAAMSRSENNMGEALEKLGQTEEALRAYERSVDTARRLVEAKPGVPTYRERLADALRNVAGAFVQKDGRQAEAVVLAGEAVALYQALSKKQTNVSDLRDGEGHALAHLAAARLATGDGPGALAAARESVIALADARRLSPDDPLVQAHMVLAQERLAEVLIRLGQIPEALASIAARRTLCVGNADRLYGLACELARCELASGGATPAPSPALTALNEAVAAGWSQTDRLESDPTWQSYRDLEAFRTILGRLHDRGWPTNPFGL